MIGTPYDLFWSQFIISDAATHIPAAWNVTSLDGWLLGASPDLNVTLVRSADAALVGAIVGDAIAPTGFMIRDTITLADSSEATWEQVLHGFGGRFATVVISRSIARVDTDPMGSMGVTFAIDAPIAASTSTLIQYASGTSPEKSNVWEEYPERRLGEGQSIPGGITADPRIGRLLPNHRLDLRTMTQRRWWPRQPIAYCEESHVPDRIDTIFQSIRSSLVAISRESPLLATLTAGRDTRMILAATCPELRQRMTFFSIWPTFENPVPRVVRDAKIATMLAGLAQRPHFRLPTISPDDFPEALRRTYLDRIGYAGHWRKGSEFWTACEQHFECSKFGLVMGFGGEVTTYPIGRPAATTMSKVTAEKLVRHLIYVPVSPRMVRAMRWWLDGLPSHIDVDRMNDLLWLENALACLSLPHLHGFARFRTINIPFCQRRLIEASYEIPPRIRRSMLVSREVFARSDLPLRKIPCNNQSP